MSVVIDFESVTLDGTVAGSVPYVAFDAYGVSEVFSATARPAESNKTRLGPNPVYNFSSDIRLSLDGEAFEDWGDDLTIESALPAVFYLQFRRTLNGEAVDLTDSIGMLGNNIIDLEGDAFGRGTTVSAGSGAAVQTQPASGSGLAVSAGLGVAAQINPAAGAGTTVSAGSGAATDMAAPQYATGAGTTASAGLGAAVQKQPSTGLGVTVSAGSGAATEAETGPAELANGTYFFNTSLGVQGTRPSYAGITSSLAAYSGLGTEYSEARFKAGSTYGDWTTVSTLSSVSYPTGATHMEARINSPYGPAPTVTFDLGGALPSGKTVEVLFVSSPSGYEDEEEHDLFWLGVGHGSQDSSASRMVVS